MLSLEDPTAVELDARTVEALDELVASTSEEELSALLAEGRARACQRVDFPS